MAEQTSEAEAVKILADDARQAWMLRAERVQAIIRELSAANLAHDDPEFSAKLEVCERVLAAFIAAVQEWPADITMSSVLQQRAKLSPANAAVLQSMKALPVDEVPEKLRDKALGQGTSSLVVGSEKAMGL